MDLFFSIPAVALRVSANADSLGRVENYSAANRLMRRLGEIGARGLVLTAVSEGGAPWPESAVDSLNHYLRAGKGLRYFKRVCRTEWRSKYGWAELRGRIGAPPIFPL
ncbi:MAG: hypothetical protein C0502_05085 [Opitutus sp.]|nr:hypothetical protein [Opitutus sp.]